MADLKISQLTSGDPAQDADDIPVNRSGSNRRITPSGIRGANLNAIKALATAANKLTLWTGSGTAALMDCLAWAQAFIGAANLAAAWTALGLGSVAALAVDTDTALAANSDTRVASQKATKAYVDALIAASDAMVFKGVIDCSANPNYPAADRGWTYRVSVAGKIGGASGKVVEAGDILICLTDGTASGNDATVGSAWNIVQTNIDGAVVGPASATSGNIATFSGTTGKVIQDGGKALPSGTVVGTSDTQLLQNKKLEDSTTTIVDDGDNTKVGKFQMSGVTTGTTRTLTWPNLSGIIATLDNAQTFTAAQTVPSTFTINAQGTPGARILLKGGSDTTLAGSDLVVDLTGSKLRMIDNGGSNNRFEFDISAGSLTAPVQGYTFANLEATQTFSGAKTFSLPPRVPTYTVATVPSASTYARGIIYVSDGAASKRMAYSNGTNWLWISTDATVS